MKKLIRITTVPGSLGGLLTGQLKFMSDYFEVIGISSGGNEGLSQVGKQEGVRVLPVNMTRQITPLQDLKALYELYKIFRRESPDIVNTHTPKAGTLGMIAAYLAGVPLRLHTIAGLPLLEARGAKRIVLDWVEKLTYRCATQIYPNSNGMLDIIVENKYTTSSKLKVIGRGSSNGIDLDYFNPSIFTSSENEAFKNTLGIKSTEKVLVFIGRLVRDKGINELVEAFEQVSKSEHDVKLVLVGPMEEDLDPLSDNAINSILNNEDIISVGNQKDVRPFLAISDILVFPSYREGFPNVVLQAGAMGVPAIVTNINGCNEIITNNKNGWIIDVKSVGAIYEAIMGFITGGLVPEYDNQQIRDHIKERYERKVLWNLILEEYQSLMDG